MAIAITADAIVDLQTVVDLLKISGDEARFLINSASDKFLKFTARARITNGSVTEYQVGDGLDVFWLHATPITAFTSVETLSDGEVVQEITGYDYDAESGRVGLHNDQIPFSEAEHTLKIIYTAGWDTVPGDIQQSALELIRVEHDRLAGRVGIKSESVEGHSVSYQTADLPDSVRLVWERYRFLI